MSDPFLEALAAAQSTFGPPAEPLRRLYHDDHGHPLFYSQEDLPGKYVDVTPDQFMIGSMRVRVRDGKLIENQRLATPKLVPADSGTPCHPQDITIVVTENKPHQRWQIKK